MRAYAFVDDEQATTTLQGPVHWRTSHPKLPTSNVSFGSRAFTTDTIARRRRSWFASFPPFSSNDWLAVLREGPLVPLEKIP
jgi:hypothetical protein